MCQKKVKKQTTIIKPLPGTKLDLIKSFGAWLDQSRVEGLKLDFCKTLETKNALNPFY
jgi:hypothetical protein